MNESPHFETAPEVSTKGKLETLKNTLSLQEVSENQQKELMDIAKETDISIQLEKIKQSSFSPEQQEILKNQIQQLNTSQEALDSLHDASPEKLAMTQGIQKVSNYQRVGANNLFRLDIKDIGLGFVGLVFAMNGIGKIMNSSSDNDENKYKEYLKGAGLLSAAVFMGNIIKNRLSPTTYNLEDVQTLEALNERRISILQQLKLPESSVSQEFVHNMYTAKNMQQIKLRLLKTDLDVSQFNDIDINNITRIQENRDIMRNSNTEIVQSISLKKLQSLPSLHTTESGEFDITTFLSPEELKQCPTLQKALQNEKTRTAVQSDAYFTLKLLKDIQCQTDSQRQFLLKSLEGELRYEQEQSWFNLTFGNDIRKTMDLFSS